MLKEKLLESLRAEMAFKQIITSDSQQLEILHRLKEAASKQINILIQGETGTGKELCAQAIHYLSSRRDKPFIPLNCGIGPAELFDSVLFGHARGAFTNAIADRVGLAEEADKGFLFLDEINSLHSSSQMKLNRFLVSGEFRRLGENKLRKVDVRIIAASNTPLDVQINRRNFREDLFYRISEYIIELPPLRERKGDIRLLMDHFLEKYRNSYGKSELKFSDDAYQIAEQYHWPGNVRELENVVKRSIIDAEDTTITSNHFHLPNNLQTTPVKTEYLSLPLHEAKTNLVNEFEAIYLQHYLRQYNGNVEECARQCGKHRSALWALLKKHRINPQTYRR